jgi:hypothetical protein
VSVRALDATLIGATLSDATFRVTEEDIRLFARAIGDLSPQYVDGSAGLVAPPTFAVTLRDEDAYTTNFWASVGVTMAQVLNAEVELDCERPILPGRAYVARVRIADLYEKLGKSGRMVFIVRETVITEAANDERVAVLRHTNVVREKGA